ncbi:leucine-rich repeat protein, partial [Mycoplasma sp. SK341A]
IANYCFLNTAKLKQINAPKISTVGLCAFSNSSINEFNFSNISKIGDYAFSDTKINGKIAANLVTSLGNNAFKGTKITEVEMNSLESLNYAAFQEIITLKKATLSKLVNIVGSDGDYGTFRGTGIEEFIAPVIEEIGSNAFAKLSKVTKVTLKVPSTVQIAQNAFDSQDKYQIVQP